MRLEELLTPALLLSPAIVEHNLDVTLRLLGGDANRWRPHLKTAKIPAVMKQILARGVRQFKCATTLELVAACEIGAEDVLVAYPCWGPRAKRVREIAEVHPSAVISVLVETAVQLDAFRGSNVGIFIDVNPGGDRTGIGQDRTRDVTELAGAVRSAGLAFRGLHYYDGHHRQADLAERTAAAHAGYRQLITLVRALRDARIATPEVITSGTPSLPCALSFEEFRGSGFVHRVSAGTVVYNDLTSLEQLPELAYKPAVRILTTVVSRPTRRIFTCDAGHKTVSADAGYPNCAVEGHRDWMPLHASEEHLPVQLPEGVAGPQPGDLLCLIPRHVCPTVNNFDHAVLMDGERVLDVVPVSARGREAPQSGISCSNA